MKRPLNFFFFFSSRRRHTRLQGDWSSDVCSSDLERRADALLVGEATIGPEAMLAEEVAVVAEEEDDRVVELARALERLEEHAHALVHRGHHARTQPHLLLAPGVDRRVELPC